MNDKYIWKTLALITVMAGGAWALSGCSSMGDLDAYDGNLKEYREAQASRPNRKLACERTHGVGSDYCK